jgi:hypothetical protein
MPEDWNTYRTRFLVRAKQLTEPLRFTDPLGREHNGLPGDYLVQSSEGLLRIAPREIFEDIYVPMEDAELDLSSLSRDHRSRNQNWRMTSQWKNGASEPRNLQNLGL